MVLSLFPLSLLAAPPDTYVEGSDRYFVIEASSGGMTEIKLGKMAGKHGASEAVKEFGKHMVADHSKSGRTLQQLASKLGITVPDEPMEKHKDAIKTFKGLKKDNFDASYSAQMVNDHEATISLFEKEAENG